MSAKTETMPKDKMDPKKKKAIWFIACIVIYFIIANLPTSEGLTPEGLKSIALMVVGVISWITGFLPIAVSSLVLVFLQHIIKIQPMGPAVQAFASPTLLFVLSSFFLAFALSECGLSKRIALKITSASKGSPTRAVLYLMTATALLSTVISDVPAVAAFAPIALALTEKNNCKLGSSNFAKALLMGIAFASLIGGVATPAGSSLNVLTLSLLESTAGIKISFGQWSGLGIPFVIIMTPVAWKLIMILFKPELDTLVGVEEVEKEYKELGPMSNQEKKFLVIMIVLLIVWFTETIHKTPLPATATIGAALFFLPGINILTWDICKNRVGWDTILLIGAASSLGSTLWNTGAATWLAEAALSGIAGASSIVVILFVVVFTVAIHLLIPVNPAIVSVMVPTLAAFAVSLGVSPAFLIVPMGFTVSAAFLLPLDPVPLITYASGHYSFGDFFKAGFALSIAWTIIMTVLIFVLASPLGLF
jgi:sodium-dependent dicarboxylate transporter 2/3/5